jgi:hypothetical protein
MLIPASAAPTIVNCVIMLSESATAPATILTVRCRQNEAARRSAAPAVTAGSSPAACGSSWVR